MAQKFRADYKLLDANITEGKSPYHALCKLCNTNFSTSKSGSYDVKKHVNGPHHQKLKTTQITTHLKYKKYANEVQNYAS